MLKHRSYTISGVMANSGFGNLKLTIGKMVFIIPQAGITKAGLLKKSWGKRIHDGSLEGTKWIRNHGGEVLAA